MRVSLASLLLWGALLVILWGAFAFGAVYPWAFTPLAAGAAVIGAASWFGLSTSKPPVKPVAFGLLIIGSIGALQLVPLPESIRASLSPHAIDVLTTSREYSRPLARLSLDSPAAESPIELHTLSIDPAHTRVGVLLFVSLAVFLVGLSRLFSVTSVRPLAQFFVGTGLMLSLFAIGQSVLNADNPHPPVYGFWYPVSGARAFGPFINPNHFAGWMLMVLPITLAMFSDAVLQMMDEASQYTRNRVAMVNSPHLGRSVVFAVSTVVMAVALIMTRSRSGLLAFLVGCVLCGLMVLRRQRGARARVTIAAVFVVLLVGIGGWAGSDAVTAKFRERNVEENVGSIGNRVTIWTDVMKIVRDFPVVGTGLNTFGDAMFVYQRAQRSLVFREAHNDYLQILAEGGVLMASAVLGTIAALVIAVRKRFREAPKDGNTYWMRVGAVIGLISIALQSAVEFSLQMPGNAALFALLCAIALHQSPNLRTPAAARPSPSR